MEKEGGTRGVGNDPAPGPTTSRERKTIIGNHGSGVKVKGRRRWIYESLDPVGKEEKKREPSSRSSRFPENGRLMPNRPKIGQTNRPGRGRGGGVDVPTRMAGIAHLQPPREPSAGASFMKEYWRDSQWRG